MKRILFLAIVLISTTQFVWAGRAKIDALAQDPYISALAIDADTGEVLFKDNADATVYPASIVKLMVLLVILQRIEQGTLSLNEMVQVSNEAASMGGSQVYLDPKEQFSIEDLLYALIIQSANDAAVALAIHVAGSKEEFVSLMNQKASELGMENTQFYSVHGLPPAEGQEPDQTTAEDMMILSRQLTDRPEVFDYTSTEEREFRDGKFIMRTHNHLLASVDGCDGFKTGYFKAAGFSIIATAKRNGVRIISIVLGSKDRKTRDAKAAELLSKGFAKVPLKSVPEVIVSKAGIPPEIHEQIPNVQTKKVSQPERVKETSTSFGRDVMIFCFGLVAGLLFCLAATILKSGHNSRKGRRLA